MIVSSPSSSSSSRSTDIPDPLSPPLPIIHCFRQVFRTTSRIGTKLPYVGSYWSSCLSLSMWRSPQEYITYKLVPTSPAVSSCLVRLTLIVFVMGGRWPYSCCFLRYCLHHHITNINLFCCVLSIFALTLLIFMASFCAAMRRDSVSLSLPYPSFLEWDFIQLSIQLFFFPFFLTCYCCYVYPCVYVFSGRCNQSFSAFFI